MKHLNRSPSNKENKWGKLKFNIKNKVLNIFHTLKGSIQDFYKKYQKKVIAYSFYSLLIIFLLIISSIVFHFVALEEDFSKQVEELKTTNLELRTNLIEDYKENHFKANTIIETTVYVPIYVTPETTPKEYLVYFNEDYSFEYTPNDYFTIKDIYMIAQTVWGEARGVRTGKEKAAIVWTLCNRYDNGHYGKTFSTIITAKDQFAGYGNDYPITEDCLKCVIDVLSRWMKEKEIVKNNPTITLEDAGKITGRVLPTDYIYFTSNRKGANVFFTNWRNKDYWNWSWDDPYTNN